MSGGLWRHANGRVRAPWRALAAFSLLAASNFAIGFAFAVLGLELPSTLESLTRRQALQAGLYFLALTLALGIASWACARWFESAGNYARKLGICLSPAVPREVAQGMALGAALMVAVFAIGVLSGGIAFSWRPPDLGLLLGLLLVFLFAAAIEELVFRGYAFQALIEGLGIWPATVIGSVLFGVAHASNPVASWLGLLNTSLAGVLLAVVYWRSGSLWLPTALHWSWNVTQGPLLGLPVSGLAMPTALLDCRIAARSSLWTGGDYGPEGGLVLSVLAVALIVLLARTNIVRWAPTAAAFWRTDEESTVAGEKLAESVQCTPSPPAEDGSREQATAGASVHDSTLGAPCGEIRD